MANPTGKQLLRSSFALLRANRQMLWVPLLSTLSFLFIVGVVGSPLLLALHGPWDFRHYLVLVLALAIGNFATLLFNVALTYAASEQIEGRIIGIADAVRFAWSRRLVILKWTFFSGVVGLALNMIERRVGIVSKVIGFLAALSWAVAVFFVVPILAFENVGPIEAVRRSANLMKETFGTVTRSALRFGTLFIPAMFVTMLVVVVGVVTTHSSLAVGVPILIVGVVAFLVVSACEVAAGTYLRVILFRFATGKSVPDVGVNLHTVIAVKSK